ncbi:MAG: PP2C family protein-serine/threonine phosphatase, partial [Bacteroidia bacterium]
KQMCYSFEKKQEEYAPLNKISGSLIKNYFFDENFVFICSDNAVFLLDKNNPGITRKPQPYISKVIYNNDTILYNVETEKSLQLAFNQNKFVFEFGSNDFSEESQLEFQYFLEGYQNGFSEWTTDYKAAFDNVKLSEGEYTFHLRARNCYSQVSDDLLFRFEILPPWYRTRLAYIIYIIAGIGIILLIIKLNSQRLIALNKKLERTIEERTQTITQQKAEIEHKNQEITDSINYAQKIQIALMASMRLLDKNLKTSGAAVSPKDYFLLYNPKDIVSGDFYWATEITISGEKYFIVVIADCTGHGVPGAFMSLLCIGFLNEITREKQIVDPGKIFDELRSRIILTLNPDGSETERKDGMDAVLLGFNASSNTMSYAAANNSFYVIRNNELTVLKADKMPVGKYSEEIAKPFSTQQFSLQKGDVIYAFTDGYADQFGGPKGKKFKYKQLEEVLLEIHKMDAATQKQILNTRFLDWKNTQEQVDDVLVIGIQL